MPLVIKFHHADFAVDNNCSWSSNTSRQKLCSPTWITARKPKPLGKPKNPNLLVNTGQKVSQKDLQTENTPQICLSGVFPATVFVEDEWSYITLSNHPLIDSLIDSCKQTRLWAKVWEHQDFAQRYTTENASLKSMWQHFKKPKWFTAAEIEEAWTLLGVSKQSQFILQVTSVL